jgi:phenylacetic acid degradation operon negative regulatory protein
MAARADATLGVAGFDWPAALQPQDLAVTLLGAYVGRRPERVWSGGLVRLLGDFGFSAPAARVALARLVRRELLVPWKEGRLVFYELTERCQHVLEEGDHRIFTFGTTPSAEAEIWTVVWHAIPEELRLERGRLARRLRFLGFGSVQDGTWISPHDREEDVSALLRDLGVADFAGVLMGRPAESLEFPDLLRDAWDLDGLFERYDRFVEEFSPYRTVRRRAQLDARNAFLIRTRLVHLYREFPFLDPELPPEVVGDTTPRENAMRVFHDLYEALRPPAQDYFDAITDPARANRTNAKP